MPPKRQKRFKREPTSKSTLKAVVETKTRTSSRLPVISSGTPSSSYVSVSIEQSTPSQTSTFLKSDSVTSSQTSTSLKSDSVTSSQTSTTSLKSDSLTSSQTSTSLKSDSVTSSQSSTFSKSYSVTSSKKMESTATSEDRGMYKIQIRDLILNILMKVQEPNACEKDLFKEMKCVYENNEKKAFAEVFFRIMVVPFAQTDPNDDRKILLTFCHKVITQIGRAPTRAEQLNSRGEKYGLNTRILRLFLTHHSDQSPLVRARLVETVHKIFNSIENVQGDIISSLLIPLKDALLHRLRDKVVDVRVEAVIALSYLQDKNNSSCPIAERLIFHLRYDPAGAVRKAVVDRMTFLKEDFEFLIGATGDQHEGVRVSVFKTLAKLPLVEFGSRAKSHVILTGVQDKSGLVQKAAKALIHEWFEDLKNNILELLRHFDLTSQRRAVQIVLNSIFKEPNLDTFNKIDWTIFVDKFIPLESLSEQTAFFWRFIVKKFENSEYACRLLPEIIPMFGYLNKYLDICNGSSISTFVLTQLLQIILLIPVEEGGRYVLLDLVRILTGFRYLQPGHVRFVVLIYYRCQLVKSDVEFLKFTREIMNGARMSKETSSEEDENSEEVEVLSEETIQALKLEGGTLIFQRNELIKQRDRCIALNQLLEADVAKLKLQTLEPLLKAIRVKLGLNPNSNCRSTSGRHSQTVVDELVDDSNIYPDHALELGFLAVIEHLRQRGVASSAIREFAETYRSSAISSLSENVRCHFLELTALVGLSNEQFALNVMINCVSSFFYDTDCVKYVSLGCIFDLATRYGFEFFNGKTMDILIQESRVLKEVIAKGGETNPLKIIVLYLMKLTDSTPLQKRAILGTLKLFLTGRIDSLSILSNIMMLWINPNNESSTTFRDISCWLPNYTRLGENEAYLVADCIIPCCDKVISCRSDSPLKNANMDKFIEFIVSNTDQRLLSNMENPQRVHIRIATNILNEMKLLGRQSPTLVQYSRPLKSLNLEGILISEDRRLRRLVKQIQEFCKTGVKNTLDAFIRYLDEFEHKDEDPTEDDYSSTDDEDGDVNENDENIENNENN